jgi:competence ComEA-like helix-hairpin-helix protein
MEYLNPSTTLRTGDENKQASKKYTAVFWAGVVLNFCFVIAISRHSGKTTFINNIDGKLNPNAAPAGELAELPSLGPAKAEAIVEYRQDKEKAFKNGGDLENVKGIGEKTVEKIKEWLEFDNDTD